MNDNNDNNDNNNDNKVLGIIIENKIIWVYISYELHTLDIHFFNNEINKFVYKEIYCYNNYVLIQLNYQNYYHSNSFYILTNDFKIEFNIHLLSNYIHNKNKTSIRYNKQISSKPMIISTINHIFIYFFYYHNKQFI